MPYANLEKRREYHRTYMQTHKQVLTPEQKIKKAEYMKKFSKLNASKLATYQKERQVRDKEKISLRKKKYNGQNPEIRKAQSDSYYQKNREKILHKPSFKLYSYKRSASKRGYDFSLSTDEFNALLSSDCHYCGSPEAMGVDRKNNQIGYFSYNVVACCKTCNYMKGTLDYQQFINHIKSISNQFS